MKISDRVLKDYGNWCKQNNVLPTILGYHNWLNEMVDCFRCKGTGIETLQSTNTKLKCKDCYEKGKVSRYKTYEE